MPDKPELAVLPPGMSPEKSVFSVGSNLGDRRRYLQDAVDQLRATPGLLVLAVSPVFETKPVGYLEQPDFLNVVVIADSTLDCVAMLKRAWDIEEALGRVREIPGGPRTVDVDLVTVGNRRLESEALTLPHPRAHQRAFVLVPWREIDPRAEMITQGKVADLLENMDTTGVRRRDDIRVD